MANAVIPSISRHPVGLLLALLLGLLSSAWASAAETASAAAASAEAAAGAAAGRVIMVVGTAEAERNGDSRTLWRRALVHSGDLLRTGPDSSIQVRFNDGGLITLAADTEFLVQQFEYDSGTPDLGKAIWTLLKGGFRAISGAIGKRRPEDYEVTTEAATIGIRGTHYGAFMEPGNPGAVIYYVIEGGITVANDHGDIDLGLGAAFDVARATADTAPVGLNGLPGEGDGGAGMAVAMPLWVPKVAPDALAGADINPNASAEAFINNTLVPALQPSSSESNRLASSGNRAFVTGLGTGSSSNQLQTGPGALADDGTPLFLLNGGTNLLRQAGARSLNVVNNVNGFDVSWGVFDPSEGPGGNALLLRSNSPGGSGDSVNSVSSQVLWLLAAETDLSNLNLNRRYGADVAFLGQGSAGAISQLGFFFDSRIDLGTGVIEQGLLLVDVGNSSEEYRVSFNGQVLDGQIALAILGGTITLDDNSSRAVDLNISQLAGLFTGDAADAFAGQFFLQEDGNSDRFVQGVLLGTALD